MSLARISTGGVQAAEGLAGGDGQRIGLLAGRSGRAPDAQRPVRRGLQVLAQDVEMMRLAKERGQVRRQRIDEGLPFFRVAGLEHCDVIGEGVQPQRPQAPGQARVHHVLLDRRQRYAGLIVDELAYAVEIGLREMEFTLGHQRRHSLRIENSQGAKTPPTRLRPAPVRVESAPASLRPLAPRQAPASTRPCA